MKFLIDPNSKVHKYLSRLVDFYFLNVLFIITSGFGILIGPALVALHAVTFGLTEDGESFPCKHYLVAYKENFVRGVVLEFIMGGFTALLYFSYRCIKLLSGGAVLFTSVGLLVLAVLALIWWLLIFPYTARYYNSIRNTFKVCLQVAVLNVKKVLMLLGIGIMIFVFASMNNIFLTIILILGALFGFSSLAYVNSFFILPMFKQYEIN